MTDHDGHKIRKIVISTGAVTTLAGSGSAASSDGTGTSASFNGPIAISTDGTSVYVSENTGNKIRKIALREAATADVALHNLDDDTDVTVALTSSDTGEGTVSPTTLTFTKNNWNTDQTVTVTGVNDSDRDMHQDYRIDLTATAGVDGSAINFDGVNDYVEVNGLSGMFSTGDDFSFSAWFKTGHTPSSIHTHILFSAHDNGNGNKFRVCTGANG